MNQIYQLFNKSEKRIFVYICDQSEYVFNDIELSMIRIKDKIT
jgi:hypothetical protein